MEGTVAACIIDLFYSTYHNCNIAITLEWNPILMYNMTMIILVGSESVTASNPDKI